MSKNKEEIKKRLQELDVLIKETKERLPAHSTKPPVMIDLLELEDEYEELLQQYSSLKSQGQNGES